MKRWILPLICRRGHVTKGDIGAIKIGPEETQFEIPRNLADRFIDSLRRTEGEDRSPEGGIRIIPANGPPPRQGAGPRDKPNRPMLARVTPAGAPKPYPRGPRPRPANPQQRGKFHQN